VNTFLRYLGNPIKSYSVSNFSTLKSVCRKNVICIFYLSVIIQYKTLFYTYKIIGQAFIQNTIYYIAFVYVDLKDNSMSWFIFLKVDKLISYISYQKYLRRYPYSIYKVLN